MDSMAFKYKQPYQKQNHLNRKNNSNNNNYNYNSNSKNNNISSHNHNNQNPIFILNTATNNILPNNPQLYYSSLSDNNVVSSSSSSSASLSSSPSTTSSSALSTTTTASSSVWSSASSTMCSPAAHALQKLFSCSSKNFKLNHYGIEANGFKTKSEIFKKKSKFWKYLEGEEHNEKMYQQGIDEEANTDAQKVSSKSFKLIKSKNWKKSYESDNQNQQELSELLEYSCSLCDNCRCMDCQIGYFDCDNSDDNNSEYSFHLSAYEEDENADDLERAQELETSKFTHNDHEQYLQQKLDMESPIPATCNILFDDNNYCENNGCQQCFIENIQDDNDDKEILNHLNDFITSPHH